MTPTPTPTDNAYLLRARGRVAEMLAQLAVAADVLNNAADMRSSARASGLPVWYDRLDVLMRLIPDAVTEISREAVCAVRKT